MRKDLILGAVSNWTSRHEERSSTFVVVPLEPGALPNDTASGILRAATCGSPLLVYVCQYLCRVFMVNVEEPAQIGPMTAWLPFAPLCSHTTPHYAREGKDRLSPEKRLFLDEQSVLQQI